MPVIFVSLYAVHKSIMQSNIVIFKQLQQCEFQQNNCFTVVAIYTQLDLHSNFDQLLVQAPLPQNIEKLRVGSVHNSQTPSFTSTWISAIKHLLEVTRTLTCFALERSHPLNGHGKLHAKTISDWFKDSSLGWFVMIWSFCRVKASFHWFWFWKTDVFLFIFYFFWSQVVKVPLQERNYTAAKPGANY